MTPKTIVAVEVFATPPAPESKYFFYIMSLRIIAEDGTVLRERANPWGYCALDAAGIAEMYKQIYNNVSPTLETVGITLLYEGDPRPAQWGSGLVDDWKLYRSNPTANKLNLDDYRMVDIILFEDQHPESEEPQAR